MDKSKLNISNKTVAYNGAIAGVAAVFAYAIIVMIYTIIRTSITIYSIMPTGHRTTILLINAFSVAYSVLIFSLLMAAISAIAGAVGGVILRGSLLYFNPRFIFRRAVIISCTSAFTLLIILDILFYAMLKDHMTFDYPETFSFWFLIPASIFITIVITSGSRLNHLLLTNLQR